MSTEASNKFKYSLAKGEVDFDTDTIKICLMATAFSYDKDADETWSDVSASELAAGNGYTQDTATLDNVSITEDDVNDRCEVAWDDEVWTASGGSIGPSPGAILYDDTHASDIIIGYLDFTTERTALNGGTFTVSNIAVRIS